MYIPKVHRTTTTGIWMGRSPASGHRKDGPTRSRGLFLSPEEEVQTWDTLKEGILKTFGNRGPTSPYNA